MPHRTAPVVEPLGDSYVLVTFTDPSEEERWLRAHTLCRAVDAAGVPGIVSTYAAYDTLLVEYDILRLDSSTLVALVGGMLRAASPEDEAWVASTALYRLPVLYGGDVERVAADIGLAPAEFVELHSSEPIRIRCRGVGGSLMMSNPRAVPQIGRLPSPVIRDNRVGEVNIAGRQCSLGFSTGRATTGWLNIGRTPADVAGARESSALFRPGDRIVIEPIAADDWSDHRGRPVAVEGADL